MSATPSKKTSRPRKQVVKLSPRGRGSVVAVDDEERLLKLFAENMRVIRLKRGLAQDTLADLSDLDRTYISMAERMKRNLTIKSVQRVADALEVDARMLFTPALESTKEFLSLTPHPQASSVILDATAG